MIKHLSLLTATILLSSALGGCFLRPYHIPIQQGKIIKPDMISQLKPGMSESQVTYLLGTPDIRDPFHPNTWYYVYTDKVGYAPRAENNLIVYFKKGKVDQISGNYQPPSPILFDSYKAS